MLSGMFSVSTSKESLEFNYSKDSKENKRAFIFSLVVGKSLISSLEVGKSIKCSVEFEVGNNTFFSNFFLKF